MLRSAYTSHSDTNQAIEDILAQLGDCAPKAVVFFAAHTHDGCAISKTLHEHYKGAEVIGCTTAGEFSEKANGTNGVSALALTAEKVKRCAGGLAKLEGGIDQAIEKTTLEIAGKLGLDLRQADPSVYAGIALLNGLGGQEERINEVLGNVAPLLSFVGGSAGDNLEFKQTTVFHNGESSTNGAVLMIMEMNVPFEIVKTCSFRPLDMKFTITNADVPNRVVIELDGKPAAQAYAEALGKKASELDSSTFMLHPLGLMISEEAWIRSPQQLVADGGIKFYCQILEGMEVHIMESTDVIAETCKAIEAAKKKLVGVSGGLMFNCILRRLELDAKGVMQDYIDCFKGLTVAGFHTYGECWMGHINQTLTGIMF